MNTAIQINPSVKQDQSPEDIQRLINLLTDERRHLKAMNEQQAIIIEKQASVITRLRQVQK